MKPKITFLILLSTTLLMVGNFHVSAQDTVVSYQGRVRSGGSEFTGIGQFKFAVVTVSHTTAAATATATISGQFLTIINITSGGNGYFTPPTVTIIGGGGSGAIATASVSGGVVTQIFVTNPGSGYTATPTILIAPPPENPTFTTYWSNDGSSVDGSEPTEAVTVPVTDGLFTVRLGDMALANMTVLARDLFQQPDLHLRIWFDDGDHGFAALQPTQPLTATPYALVAGSASTLDGTLPATALSGIVPDAQLSSSVARTSQVWLSSGNSGTDPLVNFLGTTDEVPLEVQVAGLRALRLEPTGGQVPNLQGGAENNVAKSGVYGAVIGGGSANTNTGAFATIPGGTGNVAGEQALAAGTRAKANHTGAFVWADATDADFASTAGNQFLIRANGGVGIGHNNPAAALDVKGTVRADAFQGSGSALTGIPWGSLSGVPADFSDGVDNNSGGDITGVTAGTGLTGGATSGNVTLSAAFSGTGAASTVARSDHQHDTRYYTRSTATSTFLNSDGPDTMTTKTTGATLTVNNTSTSGGVSIDATTASTANGQAAVVGHAAGVSGLTPNAVAGVRGDSNTGLGVVGTSWLNSGVRGNSASGTAVEGQSLTGYGIYGTSLSSHAVYADGTMHATDEVSTDSFVRADRVVYNAARTHYYSVGGGDFRPNLIDGVVAGVVARMGDFTVTPGGGSYILNGTDEMITSVRLPHGATITSVRGYFRDNSTVASISLKLYRVSHTGRSRYTLATLTTQAAGSATGVTTLFTNITPHVVDNANYAYYLRAYSNNWSTRANNMQILSARISYTLSEAQ